MLPVLGSQSAKTGVRPGHRDAERAEGGGVRRDQHLVARPDAQRPHSDMDRVGAVADARRRAARPEGGELLLEGGSPPRPG